MLSTLGQLEALSASGKIDDLVALTPLFMKPDPVVFTLDIDVTDSHRDRSIHPGERYRPNRAISALSRKPTTEAVSMQSRSSRVSSAESTEVLPFFTTYLGPSRRATDC